MCEQIRNSETISRKQLYDLVSSTPLLTLSKKYFISDNGLRKICKRMNIPLPKAGHWMKLQFGRKVSIKALSEKYEGDTEVELKIRGENDTVSLKNELNILTNEMKQELGDQLIVPEKLRRPDKLIIAARQQLSANDLYQTYTYKNVIACGDQVFDIIIGKQNLKRTLLFLDTRIKSLQAT